MKYLIYIFLISPFILVLLADEVDALEAKLSRRKKIEKDEVPVKLSVNDEKFIKDTAYDEFFRKCQEKTSDREMPYLSVEELEEIADGLKNRRAKK